MTFISPSRHFIQQPRHFAKKSLFGIYFLIPKPAAWPAISTRHAGSVSNSHTTAHKDTMGSIGSHWERFIYEKNQTKTTQIGTL